MCEELEEILEYIQLGSQREGGISQFTLDQISRRIAQLALDSNMDTNLRKQLEQYA